MIVKLGASSPATRLNPYRPSYFFGHDLVSDSGLALLHPRDRLGINTLFWERPRSWNVSWTSLCASLFLFRQTIHPSAPTVPRGFSDCRRPTTSLRVPEEDADRSEVFRAMEAGRQNGVRAPYQVRMYCNHPPFVTLENIEPIEQYTWYRVLYFNVNSTSLRLFLTSPTTRWSSAECL